jgi:hypothetical protein
MDLEGTFNQLRNAVNSFVRDSNAWSRQVQDDAQKSKTPLDQADSNAFDDLANIEGDLKASVKDPPTNIEDLRERFNVVNDHLKVANTVYASLVEVSQTTDARGKENAARKSLKLLIREMNEIRNSLSTQDESSSSTAEPPTHMVDTTIEVETATSAPLTGPSNGHVKGAKPLKVRGQVPGSSVGSAKALISGAAVHTSNLFLTTMQCLFDLEKNYPPLSYGITQQFIDITQLFFDNESFSSNTIYDPPLSDSKIEGLTASWNAVIAVFADPSNAPSDCRSSDPNDFVQIEADLFKIHGLLDTLYDHLETDIVRKSTSILLPNLP